MNNLQNKKEMFTSQKKSKMPIIIGVGAIAIIASVVLFFSLNKNDTVSANYFGNPVAEPRSYIGEFISMTTIEAEITEESLIIPLAEVDQYSIVYFEAENSANETVPMMAYLTPTGRIFVGSSMCEPCRGMKFSLAGETLVCDACSTTYKIETHEFISGAQACGKLPPVNFNPTVKDGSIIIDINEVLNWRSRV